MNESNSTHLSTMARMLAFVVVFFFGAIGVTTAQTACACKGSIQVSLDEDCEAAITSDMILTNGSTCGGSTTAVVTLMKTPTGGEIISGTGSANLEEGHLYVGKTIYGKVTEASGVNSCWTTIKIEDKLAPTILCPNDLTLNCYQLLQFKPVVTENCSHYVLNIINEDITVNDCRAITGLPNDVLKVIERTYQAVDESGNKSLPCEMTITVKGLPSLEEPYVSMPINRWLSGSNELKCDQDYAKIPAGQPFAGNPSPIDIRVGTVTKLGTGVPRLLVWNPTLSASATVTPGATGNSVVLSAGTGSASLCITAAAGSILTIPYSVSVGGSANYTITPAIGAPTTTVLTGTGSVVFTLPLDATVCLNALTANTVLTVTNGITPLPFYLPVYPTPDLYCNILVSYSDVNLPALGCVTKILRTWQVLEWSCRSEQRIRTHLQMIEIVDKEGPAITCPVDFTVSTNGHSCEANVAFPAAVVKDNCSATTTVDITYPSGFIKGVNGGIGSLPVGCHTITYTAYDACYNSSTCSFVVTVEDNTPPVAICDQNTVIGLTLDGKAWVPATSFDNGSYDECELAKMLVRRMDPVACKPCKTPEFPGFTYLGDYALSATTDKHYYYISKHRSTPDVAIKTAAAMGGYVVAINTAAENTWLYDRVQEWHLGDDYLIGLRDAKHKGTYAWLSGESSTYRNWEVGSPMDDLADGHNDYDYVRVLDSNAKWLDFASFKCEEEEWLYVVEITDPCGFSSYAQFCCSDLGTNHMVQFRVIDKAGNWNDCMVNATIQDKLPPSITCPAHMTVTCNDVFDLAKLRHSFGWPTAYDNCENPRITTDSVIEMNSCRIGKITRNFTATDAGGKTAKCTQIIIVNGSDDPFEMAPNRWPKDTLIVGCENPNDAAFGINLLGKPNLTADNICSLVGAEYEDQIFTFNNATGDACFKILRHWTVIDWCQRILLPGGGYDYRTWTHTQVIKVIDPIKPVITSNCARKSVCTYDPTCREGYIELTATGTDACTTELRWSYKIDANNDGSFESGLSKSGLGNSVSASGNYPIGSHKIVWSFEDRCGNVTKCEQLFDIFNCKAPTPYCLNGLATSLMPMDTNGDGIADTGMVEIWAKDFDNGSSHPCGYPVLLSFAPVTINATTGKPVQQLSRTFTCADLGRADVKLYAAVITPMGTVVQDFCATFINIQDNNKVCPATPGRGIKGLLATELEIPVKNVNVKLEGSEMNVITGQSGTYAFDNMNSGGVYTVKPNKNDDHLNGVSTLDLVMIQRHILGIEKITSPYKQVAADINKDGKVTASDLTELRKLILGINNTFTNNESWRFVDKAYTFQDVVNAQAEILPETYPIASLNTDMVVNFTAIKVGDVNGNVVANANSNVVEGRAAKKMALATENQSFTAGQLIHVPVVISENSEVSGFQFTINFDTELFGLESVNGGIIGMTDNNFGFAKLSEGIVTVSYNREQVVDMAEGDKVFTLTLKAKDKGLISQGLWIDSALTPAEAYSQDNSVMDIEFNVNGRSTESVVLYQNTPNPFKAVTMIGFDLPSAMDAKVTIYDVTGKALKVINNTFNKGYNSIEINKNEIGSVGVLYYTLEAGDFKATKKMVVIE